MVSIENLMNVDENAELINRDSFRNIYIFTFEGNNLESLNEVIDIL